MADTEEVKPCPFCGGEATWEDVDQNDPAGNDGASYIMCQSCLASSRLEFDRKDHLLSAWNRRCAEEVLRARVVELEGALQELVGESEGWLLRYEYEYQTGPGQFDEQWSVFNKAKAIIEGQEVADHG